MRARRLAAAVAGAAGATGLVAAAAIAATPNKGLYVGETGQKNAPDHGVRLRVNKQHRVVRFAIDWRAFCKKDDRVWDGGTVIHFPKNDPIGTFHDHGSYTATSVEGFKGKVTHTVDGHFTDKTHAKGDWKATVRVFNPDGKRVDTCKVKTRWQVGPA